MTQHNSVKFSSSSSSTFVFIGFGIIFNKKVSDSSTVKSSIFVIRFIYITKLSNITYEAGKSPGFYSHEWIKSLRFFIIIQKIECFELQNTVNLFSPNPFYGLLTFDYHLSIYLIPISDKVILNVIIQFIGLQSSIHLPAD